MILQFQTAPHTAAKSSLVFLRKLRICLRLSSFRYELVLLAVKSIFVNQYYILNAAESCPTELSEGCELVSQDNSDHGNRWVRPLYL